MSHVLVVCALVASVVLLNVAVMRLPLGTAYAMWTGIGIIGTAVFGIVCLGESVTAVKVISTVLVLLGILGLKSGH